VPEPARAAAQPFGIARPAALNALLGAVPRDQASRTVAQSGNDVTVVIGGTQLVMHDVEHALAGQHVEPLAEQLAGQQIRRADAGEVARAPDALLALSDRGVIGRCCHRHAVVSFRPGRPAVESRR
jgi:hypothetical protein